MTATTVDRTALYRLFDGNGALLYIGIAVNPQIRWAVHAREKTWWPQVADKTLEWYDERPAAEAAEVAAILSETPRFNVEHSTGRQRGDARDEYQSPYAKARQIRLATAMWRDFGKAAKAADSTRARAVVQFIAWYLRRPGAKLPARPDVEAWQQEEGQPADE